MGPHVTFVFPRDLTAKEIERFRRELKRPYLDRRVDWWGRAQVEGRLNQDVAGARVARLFLDEPSGDLLAIERMVTAGGPVKTAGEALQRLAALGELPDQNDPWFTYPISDHGRNQSPQPPPPDAIMRLERRIDGRSRTIDAVPMSAEAVRRFAPKGAITFTDEATAKAFRRKVAETGEAQTTDFKMRIDQAPPFMRADLDRLVADPGAVLTVRYDAEPVSRRVRVVTDRGTVATDVQLRLIPPPPGWRFGFHLVLDTLTVTVTMRPAGEGTDLAYNWRLDPSEASPRVRLAALDLLNALVGDGRLTLLDENFANGPTLRLSAQPLDADIAATHTLFGDLVAISDWTGESLEVPKELSAEDVQFIAQLAAVVRRRRLPLTWSRIDARLSPGALVPSGAEEISFEQEWYAELLGRRLPLGVGRATLRARVLSRHGDDIAVVPADPGAAEVDLELRPPEPTSTAGPVW